MAVYITALNSGSNGNCYYIGNDQEAVLIDAGISCKETERRMQQLHLSMDKVKAIFISHEHTDHITGLVGLCKKYQFPVYGTQLTLQKTQLSPDYPHIRNFTAYEPIKIGQFSITAIPKCHDAVDPHSFIVRDLTNTIGIFTDIGKPCDHVIKSFQECNAVFLETNYDEALLNKGKYPYFLRQRISGGNGHLSNRQALELFQNHRNKKLTHLILSHLSNNNNTPELVQEMFRPHCLSMELIIASRYEATPVYCIQQCHYASAVVGMNQ